MTTSALSRRYARAILELAVEQNQLERVGKELSEFAAVCKGNTELRNLLTNPGFSAEQRKKVLVELTTRAGLSPLARNSVLYLSDAGRLIVLPEVAHALIEASERSAGSLRAEVTSAAPLPDNYYSQLQRSLEQATGRKVNIDKKTDPTLIAGVVTRMGDKVLDGSVRSRLRELKDSLKTT